MWKLSIEDDQAQRSVVPLARTEYQIGRADDNPVRLTERNISRHHARIRLAGSGWLLEDLGSYNGVFVNGTRIAGACELSAGDAIQVGEFVLQLHSERAPLEARFSGDAPAVDRLVLLSGPRAGSEFPVGDDIRLGADPKCAGHLPYPGVHAHHATLHRVADARFELIDHAGDGSTQVNGVALPRALLAAGDEVLIGQARLQLVAAGARYTAPAPAPIVAATAQSPTPAPAAVAQAGVVAPATEASSEPVLLPAKRKGGMRALLAALVVGGAAVAAFFVLSGEDREAPALAPLAAAPSAETPTEIDTDAEETAASDDAERLAAVKAAEEAAAAAEAHAAEELAAKAKADAYAAAIVAEEEAALSKAQDDDDRAAESAQRRALVEPASVKRRPSNKKTTPRNKNLSGGIQRKNPFSTNDLATSGDTKKMTEAKRRLVKKARSGRASAKELKTLRALCGQLKDFACRSEATKLLEDKQRTR